MIGHPDADALAACREGLLGRRRSARIRAHLARCSRCASLDRELAAVSTLLASAPAPRIPDELATRLDTVLAAESAARARGESPAPDGIPATADGVPAGIPAITGAGAGPTGGQDAPADSRATTPGNRAGSRPGRPRTARPPRPWRVTALRAASVTAVLLVIAGGGYGLSQLLHTNGGTSSTSTSREAGGSSGAGGAISGPNAGGGAGSMVGGSHVPVVHSGTDYQPGRLAAQANAALVAAFRAKAGVHAAPASSAPGFTMDGCLKYVGAARPTVVDEARYGGQPATIIIRAPAGGQPGNVWVVAPSCSAAGRHLVTTAVLPGSG